MLIPYIFIIFSLVGLGFIILRKIPVLAKLPEKPEESLISQPFLDRLTSRARTIIHPEYWSILFSWLEKILRKIRIFFLKLDNLVISLITRIREKSRQLAIKSKTWMSEKRLRKIEKLRLLADLKRTKEEKEEIFLRIIRQNPKDIKAYKELGLLYLEEKNYQDAESAFKEVLKINSEDEMAKEKLEEMEVKGER